MCVNYATLSNSEKDLIINKISTFTKEGRDKISLYGLNVSSKDSVYDHIKAPRGLICDSKTKLKDGFADRGGWRDSFVGYQTTVDVQFHCEKEDAVEALLSRIIRKVRVNGLHDLVGYHVIGWVLHLWDCPAVLLTSEPV